jgi:class 3 adenylate cyclase
MTATERQLAILFADLSGSTSLYERLGDREALAAVDSVVDLLRSCVAARQGHVVKTIGDEVMAAFADADAALQAATDMQHRIAALPPFGETRLAIRIGFHFGPVLEENADYFGDGVNTAARMAGLAKGGQIMTTAATAGTLSPGLRQGIRALAALAVKGKQAEVEVCEVLWQGGENVTMLAGGRQAPRVETVLRLSHGGRETVLDASRPSIQIGRDPALGIALEDRMASRLHGRIERRADRFQYVDLSTNGSYLTLDGDAETIVRRDQLTLRGRGKIAFGHSATDPGAEVVAFACEYRARES